MYLSRDLAYVSRDIMSNTRCHSRDVMPNLSHVIWRLNDLRTWKRQRCMVAFGNAFPNTVLSVMSLSVITMATFSHLTLFFLNASAMAVNPSSVSRLVSQHAMISLCPLLSMQSIKYTGCQLVSLYVASTRTTSGNEWKLFLITTS